MGGGGRYVSLQRRLLAANDDHRLTQCTPLIYQTTPPILQIITTNLSNERQSSQHWGEGSTPIPPPSPRWSHPCGESSSFGSQRACQQCDVSFTAARRLSRVLRVDKLKNNEFGNMPRKSGREKM